VPLGWARRQHAAWAREMAGEPPTATTQSET
jgi:hypothetical protein